MWACTARRKTLVTWVGLPSRMIRTYEVLRSDRPDGPLVRINRPDLICTAFLDVREAAASAGFYWVQAVDYWDRRSPLSEMVASA